MLCSSPDCSNALQFPSWRNQLSIKAIKSVQHSLWWAQATFYSTYLHEDFPCRTSRLYLLLKSCYTYCLTDIYLFRLLFKVFYLFCFLFRLSAGHTSVTQRSKIFREWDSQSTSGQLDLITNCYHKAHNFILHFSHSSETKTICFIVLLFISQSYCTLTLAPTSIWIYYTQNCILCQLHLHHGHTSVFSYLAFTYMPTKQSSLLCSPLQSLTQQELWQPLLYPHTF